VTFQATDAAGNTAMVTRSWTVVCSAPDPTGAAGLLHLDDTGQVLANAVAGGAPASLGDTPDPEPTGEPTEIAGGRFGGALGFAASDGDHAAWPVGLGPTTEWTFEMWAQPSAAAGTHELITNGGTFAVRASTSGAQVKFSLIVSDASGSSTATSTNAVATGAWHHVLVSYQAPSLRLWVDGVRTQVDGVTLAAPVSLDALRLGGAASLPYDGALDEVWFAQAAITTDEAALARYCPLQ
jgi:hypothetical protein